MIEPETLPELALCAVAEGLAALLASTQQEYRRVEAAGHAAKAQLERDLRSVATQAEAESRGYLPPNIEQKVNQIYLEWLEFGDYNANEQAPVPLSGLREAAIEWRDALARCDAELHAHRDAHLEWMRLGRSVFRKRPPVPRLSATFRQDLVMLRHVRDSYPRLRDEFISDALRTEPVRLQTAFELERKQRLQALKDRLHVNLPAIQKSMDRLAPASTPWKTRLERIAPLFDAVPEVMRLGVLGDQLPLPEVSGLPCVVGFPAKRGLAILASPESRGRAQELVRSVLLRMLVDSAPGDLRVSLIDPSAMGRTFAEFMHLGDYDEQLIDSGVKTSPQAIERCLEEQASHVEMVVSKYLRGQFENIREYNRHAGDMGEPFRLLVVADYPRQFSDRAAEQLLSVVENGPRAGVYTMVLHSAGSDDPRTVPLARLTHSMNVVTVGRESSSVRFGADGATFEFTPDTCPSMAFSADGDPISAGAALIEQVGRAATGRYKSVVTLDAFLQAVNRNRVGVLPEHRSGAQQIGMSPDTWWTATTADCAVAPIGRSGSAGVASMFFSSTKVAGGAIVVGLPRSGKTTSLHAMIMMMSLLYSPDELELYLIDAKHGVEFKQYGQLPHARMVSVHSEREFSVAVLKSLQRLIRDRAEKIKSIGSGLSNITEFRRESGETLSRVVVVIDEFHELFEEADQLGYEAFAAFSDIVRMGPFSGVHVVVASQTLSSMPAMDRQTLTLLPQRVAFMCNEYDADIVMGESNKAPSMLSKTGEGLFNPARGDESKNQLFRGLYLSPDERARVIQQLREKANAQGWTRRPRVFDGDVVVSRPSFEQTLKPGGRFTVPLGEPFSLADTEALAFSRARGSNLLIVGDRLDEENVDVALRGVLHSILHAASAQEVELVVVDFAGDEEFGGVMSVMETCDSTGARYVRSSRLDDVVRRLAEEVSQRIAVDDYRAPTRVLLLCGVQRAVSLKPYDPYESSDSPEAQTSALLAAILRSGPEVGVHVVVDLDSAVTVDARIGSDLLGEFALRVTGSAATLADVSIVTGTYGRETVPRSGQLLISDVLKGQATRVRGYESMKPPHGLGRQ